MKKMFALLFGIMHIASAFAQNVGLGTNQPKVIKPIGGTENNTKENKPAGNKTVPDHIGIFTSNTAMSNAVIDKLSASNDTRVGIGTNTPQAALDVTSTNTGFLPPRLDSNQRNAIASPATGLTIYNTSIKAYECYNGSAWYSTVHYIGEYYGGGIVFYTYDNGQHGLIAATSDQSSGIQWYNSSFKNTGTTGDGFGAGEMNTAMLVAGQIADNPNGSFAAKICADYTVTVAGITYGDWYLPSKYELNLLYAQKNVVGNFASEFYWSSTEYSFSEAWYQLFDFGNQHHNGKNYPVYVRAIRAF